MVEPVLPTPASHDAPFRDQVVLVTGSSSGIGAATAHRFAALGATLVINSSTSVEPGEALARELPGASYIQADIADEEQARHLVDEAVRRHGALDVLINNAGTTEVIPHHDVETASPDVWRRIFDVNVLGTWQVTVAATEHLRASGHGQVVNVSSLAGERPTGSSIPYACSKAAVSHMTRLLANALAPAIRVNAVAPGLVDTPWTAEWETVREFVNAQAPLQRTATPDDVAELIVGPARWCWSTGAWPSAERLWRLAPRSGDHMTGDHRSGPVPSFTLLAGDSSHCCRPILQMPWGSDGNEESTRWSTRERPSRRATASERMFSGRITLNTSLNPITPKA
jgi:ketoreductase RED2